MNILLVDDDYLLAKGTAKLIERLSGHKVQITDDPSQIFYKCENREVDLVMMDVNIPGAIWEGKEVSGADLCCLLKNNPKTANIPIILVTAYAMLTERNSLLNQSQANDLCTKPITNYEELIVLINGLVEKASKG